MARTLVTYFSATGTTARVAEVVADELGADLLEIEPAQRYTAADLNWNDKRSRSTLEMNGEAQLPGLAGAPTNLTGYDAVLVGFPIWWYVAPKAVDARVTGNAAKLAGKRVITFATSGGSGMGRSTAELAKLAPLASWQNGEVVNSERAARSWARGLGL